MSLTSAEFAFIAALVRRGAAIVLEAGKEYLVEARLKPLAQEYGLATVSEFISRAQLTAEPETERRIVDALTTNETSFFRDAEPFAALGEVVLPQLLLARAATRHLRVWSAACSSGQEPYSLSMQLSEALPPGWTFEILGSDISTEMLRRAETGWYGPVEVNRGLTPAALGRHFERSGTGWQVSGAVRRSVTFRRLNLAAPLPHLGRFDVIFLRNVLIYFDLETKRSVLQQVVPLLRPDGWLFLGSAETMIGVDDGLERVVTSRTSAYRPRSQVVPLAARVQSKPPHKAAADSKSPSAAAAEPAVVGASTAGDPSTADTHSIDPFEGPETTTEPPAADSAAPWSASMDISFNVAGRG
jgi:chemotaxis protein methyltransferase CheR